MWIFFFFFIKRKSRTWCLRPEGIFCRHLQNPVGRGIFETCPILDPPTCGTWTFLQRATSILEYSIPLVRRRIFHAGIYVGADSLRSPATDRPIVVQSRSNGSDVLVWSNWVNVFQHILLPIQRCHVASDSSPSFPLHVR